MCLGWLSKELQSTWVGNSCAKVRMTRLVVRSMRKDDGLLDCSCIMGTDYRSVNLIGRTCKLFRTGHLDWTNLSMFDRKV